MSYPPFVVDNLRKTVDNLGWGCTECIFVIPYVGDEKLRRFFMVMGLTRYMGTNESERISDAKLLWIKLWTHWLRPHRRVFG